MCLIIVYFVLEEFVTVLANKQVKIGEDVMLRCEGIPENGIPKVTWEKNGEKLDCVEGKHSMQQNSRLFVLVIKNAEEGDEGKYTLKMENSKGSVSCSATVTVISKYFK